MPITGLTYSDIVAGAVPGSSFWWMRGPTADEVIRYRRGRVERLICEIKLSDKSHPEHWSFCAFRLAALRAAVDTCDARLAELGVSLPTGEPATPPHKRGSARWFKTAPLSEVHAYRAEMLADLAAHPRNTKCIEKMGAHIAARVALETADRRIAERGIDPDAAVFQEAAE